MLRSFTDRQRALLLAAGTAVLYTPPREHFGIVPLEAMAASRPVVASNSGGPCESVVHRETGLLCEPTPVAFAGAMQFLLVSRQRCVVPFELHVPSASLPVCADEVCASAESCKSEGYGRSRKSTCAVEVLQAGIRWTA